MALSGATVVVAATDLLPHRVHDRSLFGTRRSDAYEPWRTWQDYRGVLATVSAAILAANPHNTQAWHFAVHDDRVDVLIDAARLIGAIDPGQREIHVGLGCALENLSLAARANGLVPEIVLAPRTGNPAIVARVKFADGRILRTALHRAIPHRHSNRGAYEVTPVPQELLEEMTALADPTVAPARLRWFSGEAERAQIGSLIVGATEAQINDEQQSIDGFRWFRFTTNEIEQHRDGLTIDGLGLPDAQRELAKTLPPTSRADGDRFFLDRTRDVHVATAAAFGVITVPDDADLAQRLAGGRLLQRVHLWTTAHGLAFQHMNQITERADREVQLGTEPTFGRALDDVVDGRNRHALVMFRIGHPTVRARLSPRRRLRDVVRR